MSPALRLLALLLPAAGLIGGAVSGPARAAEGPGFEVPLRCAIPTVCFVLHYVDSDPGPGTADYSCGTLTYADHTGTDIRTRTWQQMREGVDVIAAAPGRVLRIRDGMADVSVNDTGRDAIMNRRAGNSVIIDHGGGWETQYSHMKRGSIRVRPGDQVEAGETIGQMGLSGDTNFPHLHFTVRRDRDTFDPFSGLAMGSGCGRSAGSLWSPEAQATLAYRGGGLLAAGFAEAPPDYPRFLEQEIDEQLTRQSPALIAWMVVWGARAGDHWSMQVTGPGGQSVVAQELDQPADDIRAFRFLGRKRPPQGWPAGIYRARLRLTRATGGNTEALVDHQASAVIE